MVPADLNRRSQPYIKHSASEIDRGGTNEMSGTTRKRVLVTGGAGFIGSHLCARLVAAGDDVICLDNYFTGVKDNIVALTAEPNFELLRHDVTFPLYVGVDEIYNLA